MYEVVSNFSSIVYYVKLLRLSFDHANMARSTCVAQSVKQRPSDLDITGLRPPAAIRHAGLRMLCPF